MLVTYSFVNLSCLLPTLEFFQSHHIVKTRWDTSPLLPNYQQASGSWVHRQRMNIALIHTLFHATVHWIAFSSWFTSFHSAQTHLTSTPETFSQVRSALAMLNRPCCVRLLLLKLWMETPLRLWDWYSGFSPFIIIPVTVLHTDFNIDGWIPVSCRYFSIVTIQFQRKCEKKIVFSSENYTCNLRLWKDKFGIAHQLSLHKKRQLKTKNN